MKKYSLYFAVFCWLLMIGACSKNGGRTTSVVPDENGDNGSTDGSDQETSGNQDGDNGTISFVDTLPGGTPFMHPGLLHSQEDFDRVKQNVDAGTSPWIDGWNKLVSNSHAQLSYTPHPVETLIRGGNSREEPRPDNYSNAMNDAAAAYQLAIRWKITGDDSFADAAIKILDAWSSTCKEISGDTNTALAGGLYGYQFANAGEILRDYSGWGGDAFEQFKEFMMRVFYSNNQTFLTSHWGTCNSHYWANWDLAALASKMAIGVLTDNRQMYNEAIIYFQKGVGSGNIYNAINHVYGDSLAQWQESGRDQGHCTLDVALMGVVCQQAWNQGDDLFGLDNNRFLKGSEYVAKYNVAQLEVPFTEYINCEGETHTVISANGRGTVRPMWALVYNHYVQVKGLRAKWTELAKNFVTPEGGGGDYGPNSGGYDQLGFGTLMYSR